MDSPEQSVKNLLHHILINPDKERPVSDALKIAYLVRQGWRLDLDLRWWAGLRAPARPATEEAVLDEWWKIHGWLMPCLGKDPHRPFGNHHNLGRQAD